MIVVGIDPSLTSTGIAVVDTEDRLTIQASTMGSTDALDASWSSRSARVRALVRDVVASVDRDAVGLVVIESPSLAQRNAGSAHDRAGLWWGIYWALTEAGVPVLPVPPTVRAKYATGKGNAGKDQVLLAVSRRYPHAPIRGNDDADALVLAAIGARVLGEPIEESLPQAHLDAMATVHLDWPEE